MPRFYSGGSMAGMAGHGTVTVGHSIMKPEPAYAHCLSDRFVNSKYTPPFPAPSPVITITDSGRKQMEPLIGAFDTFRNIARIFRECSGVNSPRLTCRAKATSSAE